MSFKISVIKKNQVVAWMLTLILGIAGVLNYANDPKRRFDVEVSGRMEEPLGEAVLVDSPNLISNVDDYLETLQNEEKVSTAKEYFAKSRIERNDYFAEKIAIYEKILENASISEEQKKQAQEELKHIHEQKNAILVAENLIRMKGMGEVVILQNGDSINVVVAEEDLTEAKVAQIQRIICSEMGGKAENIHVNNL